MNVCDKCGYKVISNAMFEKHKITHVVDAAPVEVKPEIKPEAEVPVDNSIVLRFSKSVEVYINGIPYVGKEIKVKNMNVASEIVRIAREAYGPTILL